MPHPDNYEFDKNDHSAQARLVLRNVSRRVGPWWLWVLAIGLHVVVLGTVLGMWHNQGQQRSGDNSTTAAMPVSNNLKVAAASQTTDLPITNAQNTVASTPVASDLPVDHTTQLLASAIASTANTSPSTVANSTPPVITAQMMPVPSQSTLQVIVHAGQEPELTTQDMPAASHTANSIGLTQRDRLINENTNPDNARIQQEIQQISQELDQDYNEITARIEKIKRENQRQIDNNLASATDHKPSNESIPKATAPAASSAISTQEKPSTSVEPCCQ